MGLSLEYIHSTTLLSPEEMGGLKIKSISTQGELDEFEQQNIEKAIQWTFGKKLNPASLVSEKFILEIHKRMFSDVWKWAGKFRKTEKNLGIPSFKIPTELKILLDDTVFWIQNDTYSTDEICIRFKHRLVSIHCFSNGNGRHSRLMADLITERIFQIPVFTWGMKTYTSNLSAREIYLSAIKSADKLDYKPLLEFARS